MGPFPLGINTQPYPNLTMQIVHLSDTHLGTSNNVARLDAVINDVLSFGDPSNTTFVHTGYLVDTSTVEQHSLGLQALDRIAASGRRVLLAPGNHDCGGAYFVDPHPADAFKQTLKRHLYNSQPHAFPVLTLTSDVAFIGLDSNEGEMGFFTRLMAEGHLGDAQLAKLSNLLDDPQVLKRQVVVYMHHQPFMGAFAVRPDIGDRHYIKHILDFDTTRFRRLKDAYSFVNVVRDRIDILLCGHRHLNLDYCNEARRYGFKMALDGSSTTGNKMHIDRMRYRVIDTQTGTYDTRYVKIPR
jgi:3',5'-cyclic AMP phosphodiesterase CpdA